MSNRWRSFHHGFRESILKGLFRNTEQNMERMEVGVENGKQNGAAGDS